MIRPLAALLLAPLLGCFMTADPDRWKEAGAGDQSTDQAQIDLGTDGPLADNPVADMPEVDGPPRDLPAVDGPGVDLPPSDLPTPDLPPPDLPPPDLPPPQTQVLLLADKVDDGEVDANGWMPDGESGFICMGYWGSGSTWGYHRFALTQAIPAGAQVKAAVLELFGHDTQQWDTATEALEIRAEKTADALEVTSSTKQPFIPGGPPVTVTAARWPASGGLAWTVGGYNSSSDLSSVLQEVVNAQGGLAQGAHVQLWVRGAQITDGEVTSYAYGTPGFKPARLTITWSP